MDALFVPGGAGLISWAAAKYLYPNNSADIPILGNVQTSTAVGVTVALSSYLAPVARNVIFPWLPAGIQDYGVKPNDVVTPAIVAGLVWGISRGNIPPMQAIGYGGLGYAASDMFYSKYYSQ